MGEAFFYQKNYAASAQAFRNSLDGETDSTTKWVDVWAHIYLGKIYDISGDRTRAVNEYSKARQTNDDTSGAQAEAQKYLKQPYQEPGSAPASATAAATPPPAAAPAAPASSNPSGAPTLNNKTDPQHMSQN
jgi:hypothetical protein